MSLFFVVSIFLHSQRRFAHAASDIALARIMMALVFIFLLFNLPRLLLGLYEVGTCQNIFTGLNYRSIVVYKSLYGSDYQYSDTYITPFTQYTVWVILRICIHNMELELFTSLANYIPRSQGGEKI